MAEACTFVEPGDERDPGAGLRQRVPEPARGHRRTRRRLAGSRGHERPRNRHHRLKAKTPLANGYGAGNIIFGKRYVAGAVPPEGDLETDLTHLLLLYQALVEGWTTITGSVPQNPEGPASGVEATRMRWHQVERSRSSAKKAKQVHGDRCQACEQRLADIYGEDIGVGYFKAHHLSPFASLDGQPTELDPAADFAVLCPKLSRDGASRAPVLVG